MTEALSFILGGAMPTESLSSDFSPLIYGLNGPTSIYPDRFVEHVVRLTSDPTVGADSRRRLVLLLFLPMFLKCF